jgi:glycopeptide antibiotics resistance protein
MKEVSPALRKMVYLVCSVQLVYLVCLVLPDYLVCLVCLVYLAWNRHSSMVNRPSNEISPQAG